MGIDYLHECFNQELKALESKNRLRDLSRLNGLGSDIFIREISEKADEIIARLEGSTTVDIPGVGNLDINDYLGLGRSGLLDEYVSDLAYRFPIGSHSSRLLGGNHEIFALLEGEIENQTGFESALFFGSGFAANETLPQQLAFPSVNFYSDQLNHASIIDGIRHSKISKSQRFIFKHTDYEDLEDQLAKSKARCNVIFCEALYSMDGTISHLEKLQQLASSYNGVVVIDEAHSFGLMGAKGAGLASTLKSKSNIIAIVTCGKAVATSGAFILGSKLLRKYLINRSRHFIYTTAPSPLSAAATLLSLKIIERADKLRKALTKSSNLLIDSLEKEDFDCGNTRSHIIPVITKSEDRAIKLANLLAMKGLTVGAIRPPTVPDGESRVRLSLHAGIKEKHTETILETVKSFWQGCST